MSFEARDLNTEMAAVCRDVAPQGSLTIWRGPQQAYNGTTYQLASEMLTLGVMSDPVRVFGKRILLVDDDPSARESIKLLLSIDRHNVIEAKNGQEALELFHRDVLDLVIIDYFMPQMEGSQVAEQMKLSSPSLPILMVTAYMEKLVDCHNPVDAILPKPFGIAELRQAIATLVN